MTRVGVIGCGLMGSGIAKNLLKHNYQVHVYDIDSDAVMRLASLGAIPSRSPDEMAGELDYLILSLSSPDIIRETLLDSKKGVLFNMKKGSFILDMSTNDVALTREIHEIAETRGVSFFDCPLSGGPDGAANGKLTIMVGGNEEDYPSIVPVLQSVGKHIEYVGKSGAGQTVKLCHNMVVAGVITLLSEAFLTGESSGVSKEKLAGILQKGSGQTRAMDVFGINILDESFDNVKFSLANMAKDINLYRKLAEDSDITTFVSDTIHQLFHLAKNKGIGLQDSSAVYTILKELNE
ncbi:hypothetical protein A8F94_07755 [Bacillus sp. FJAT-27225]|uniref:NAD(P)-dependent oxidoreductase n=1 Tax=Bacillus sp. FJAT-27225 TaxID=1743144 RepID=UPI00080C22E7|nr:NAD(P)-dependent oxidoreductase [Bacillus sp. FJAT-27225]OCA87736.1 hypothetical protein A8F94_07755 [Bacillus sp. FJAT-27225]